MEIRTVTQDQWEDEGERRFGKDRMQWKFVCPVCGHVASIQDWKDAGASEGHAAFSCVGRHIEGSKDAFESKGEGPCTYAGGGLFKLNPVHVALREGTSIHQTFDFAEVEGVEPWADC